MSETRKRKPGAGRKTGTKLVDDSNRKKFLFYMPTNLYDLLLQAKKEKIQTQGYLLNEIVKQAVKTTKLSENEFKHTLVINGKEVVSITNSTPKQGQAMVARPKAI